MKLLLLIFCVFLFIIFITLTIKGLCDLMLSDIDSSRLLYLYKKHISNTYKGYDILGNEYLGNYIIINKDYNIYYKNLPLKDRINIKIKVAKVLFKIKRSKKKEIKNALKNRKKM